jgi:hypothetical protein
MVMVDSRGAFAFLLFSTLLAPAFFSRWARFVLFVLMLIILVFPYVAVDLVIFVQDVGLFSFMDRSDSQANSTGIASGRDIIWSAVTSKIVGQISGLVGYGQYGQFTSGSSASYAWMFGERGGSLRSVHNAPLQYVIDMGLIGLAVWATFWWKLFGALRNAPGVVPSVVLVFIFLMGVSEIVGTSYALDSFFILIFLCSALAGSNYRQSSAKYGG